MAPQKIAQRKRAMRVADAVNKMEGVPVRCYAIELSNAWCEGKITGAQMKETLLKSHMEMARRGKENYIKQKLPPTCITRWR